MRSDPLKAEWEELTALIDSRRRGYAFQSLVGTMFRKAHFTVTPNAGTARPRQVDLIATRAEESYLIETKWWKRPVTVNEIDSLHSRLDNVSEPVVGVMVSYTGFTEGAIARAESKAKRPILLITGQEIRHTIEDDRDLVRLLRRKRDALRTHRRALFLTGRPSPRAERHKRSLPIPTESISIGGSGRTPWISCSGAFGQFTFVRELPDIDWAPGAGFGVALDIALSVGEQHGLVALIRQLADMGWVTTNARWSIQQASMNWHGMGAPAFVDMLGDWQGRYHRIDTHHTEEFCYVDVCDGGFYSLTGQVTADKRRLVWGAAISFQLPGVPLDTAPLRQLCEIFDSGRAVFFRQLDGRSVNRYVLKPDERMVLDVVGFVVEEEEREADPGNQLSAVGLVARNPFPTDGPQSRSPWWWPNVAADSELILFDLRSWHPLNHPKRTYRMWNCETARTRDALVFRPVADWDVDDDAGNESNSNQQAGREPCPCESDDCPR